MILTTSERSSEDDMKNLQMGETAVATKEGGLSLSRNLDLTDIVYPSNREVVSFENASINVDSSTDVIFGPVTQLNVNGNVTIVQNGNEEGADDGKSEKKQSNIDDISKTASSSHCFGVFLLFLNLHWIVIRNCIIVCTFLFIAVIVALILLKNSPSEMFDMTFEDPLYNNTIGNHSIIYRKRWGGRPPRRTPSPLKHPVNLLIISSSFQKFCNSSETCSLAVRDLQKSHQSVKHFTDIGYNFMIGGDGSIYVGTGWDFRNSHWKTSIGIDFLGDYIYDELTEEMIDALEKLIEQGLHLNKLSKDYKLVGENQTNPTVYLSPGPNIVKLMNNWPHYYNNTWF